MASPARRLGATLLLAGVVALALHPVPEDARLVRRFCRLAAEDVDAARPLGSGGDFLETMVTLHRHQRLHLRWCALGAIEPAGRGLAPVGEPAPARWRATPPPEAGVEAVYFLVAGPPGNRHVQAVRWPEPAVRPSPLAWWRERLF